MNRPEPAAADTSRSDFADSLRQGILIGLALLALLLPLANHFFKPAPPPAPVAAAPAAPAVRAPAATPPRVPAGPARHANFAGHKPPSDVRQMANWVVTSQDNAAKSFVIVDKKGAKVYVFAPSGRLKAAAPALLGQARGDDTVPGIGDKPLAQVLPEEKTTPAGRFIAEVGMSSTRGEDVVWVDYDAAVSMHRVLKVPERLKSLASPSIADNRMSFGCINLPPKFYEKVLRPTVDHGGAIIYVLPETRPLHDTFASFYDVDAPVKMAQR
jgi:hypothetical protein